MPRTPFETSPSATGEARKWINPTPGYVGANIFGADGKPTSIAIEPGGFVWLTEAEERMTAEAPTLPQDNPFVKEWDEPTSFDSMTGEVTGSVRRSGVLQLADEPSRPTFSRRHIPPREQQPEKQEETVTGAPELEPQPAVEGQPSPDEVVGTPEAPEKNAEALAQRESTPEQKTTQRRKPAPVVEEEPLPA